MTLWSKFRLFQNFDRLDDILNEYTYISERDVPLQKPHAVWK